VNSILDKLDDARTAERNKILSVLDKSFPSWVGKYLRKILTEDYK